MVHTHLPLLFFLGGGGNDVQTASGGIGGTGISKGPITKFGSIFVNGIEFETDTATVTIDDQPGSNSDLKLGMIVTVNGVIDGDGLTGKAVSIEFEEDIEGPIDNIDLAGNSLVVMGQTVFVDAVTLYENTTGLAALKINNMVEVSGLITAGGAIQATLIEFKSESFSPDVSKIELKGLIQRLDLVAQTFIIGTQTVKYTGTTRFEGGTADDIKLNTRLEAEGTVDENGILIATEISFRTRQMKIYADAEAVDVSANTVTLLGQTVIFNGLSEIEDKSSAEQEPLTLPDFNLGDRLRIKGDLSGGRFIAKEVRRHDAGPKVLLQGSVDSFANPLLTVFGISVRTSNSTVFRGEDDEAGISSAAFFAAVNSESTLKIEGSFVTGEILADTLEIQD